MKKKGFTLIELLAVIVILAIIALIATPIVMNVIENARKGAAERSADSYISAVKTFVAAKRLDENILEGTYVIQSDGNLCKSGETCTDKTEIKIDISKTIPEYGTLFIDKDGVITLNSMIINGYNCYQENGISKCNKSTKVEASSDTGSITTNSTVLGYSDLKIYGNSYQQTYTGKNLVNKNDFINYGSMRKYYDFYLEPGTYYYSSNIKEMVPDYNIHTSIINNDVYDYSNAINIIADYNDVENPKITITEGKIYRLLLYCGSSTCMTALNNVWDNVWIQIEKSEVQTSYEPYVGGVASPSPEYPQEIQSVGDLITDSNDPNYDKYKIPATISGKNLVNKNNFINYGGQRKYYDFYLEPGTYYYSSNIKEMIPDYNIHTSIINNDVYDYSNAINIIADYNDVENPKITITEGKIYRLLLYCGSSTCMTALNNVWDNVWIQIEKSEVQTSYEPYMEPITTNIYLDEPLRCVGDVCDYIDLKNGKVYRNVEVIDESGTKTLEESLSGKEDSLGTNINLPNITTFKGTTVLSVGTSIKPSNIEVEYYK